MSEILVSYNAQEQYRKILKEMLAGQTDIKF